MIMKMLTTKVFSGICEMKDVIPTEYGLFLRVDAIKLPLANWRSLALRHNVLFQAGRVMSNCGFHFLLNVLS